MIEDGRRVGAVGEAHLHRTYRKLGVRSRAELEPLLAERDLSA